MAFTCTPNTMCTSSGECVPGCDGMRVSWHGIVYIGAYNTTTGFTCIVFGIVSTILSSSYHLKPPTQLSITAQLGRHTDGCIGFLDHERVQLVQQPSTFVTQCSKVRFPALGLDELA